MSFDIGALITGLSQGMGSYSDIQFAEKLKQEAESRRFAQADKMQGDRFAHDEQMRVLMDELTGDRQIGAEQRGLMDQLEQVLGSARGSGMEVPGVVESAKGRMPRGDMNSLIGELQAAASLVSGANAEREAAYQPLTAKQEADIGLTEAKTEYYKTPRTSGGGGTGQDGVWSDAQINQRYMARRRELISEMEAAIKSVEDNIMLKFKAEEKAALIKDIKSEYADLDERAWTFANSTPGAQAPQEEGAGGRAEQLMAEIEGGAPAPEQSGGGVKRYDVETLAMDIAESWNAGKRDEGMAAKELYGAVRNGQLSEDEAREVMRRAREIASSGTLSRPMGQPGPEQEKIKGYH